MTIETKKNEMDQKCLNSHKMHNECHIKYAKIKKTSSIHYNSTTKQ